MKICRFDDDRLGVVEGDEVLDVSEALAVIPPSGYPRRPGDALIAHLAEVRERIGLQRATAARLPIDRVRLLSPVANPGKIVAAPVNYRKHLDEVRSQSDIHFEQRIAEIKEAGLFLKAASSLVGASEGVALRHLAHRNDHELELVAVIGKRGSNIPRGRALEHVAGYAVGLDMTLRGPQDRSMRKSIDTFSVLGPCLVTADEVAAPGALAMQLSVNGETRQQANTRDLVVGLEDLIEWASSFYTLHPGDLLFTGTPEGVGRVQPGDRIEAWIERIGRMQVEVRAAAQED